jgi:hypothetical protein
MVEILICGCACRVPKWWLAWLTHTAAMPRAEFQREFEANKHSAATRKRSPVFSDYWEA